MKISRFHHNRVANNPTISLADNPTMSLRVGRTRISYQLPVSDQGEWRHICHFFRWPKMWRVTFVTLSHFWVECDALAHENIFFNLWRFVSYLSRKRHILALPVQSFFDGEEMWRFGWDWNIFFLFPSQICHVSWKREAGGPFKTVLNMHIVALFYFGDNQSR